MLLRSLLAFVCSSLIPGFTEAASPPSSGGQSSAIQLEIFHAYSNDVGISGGDLMYEEQDTILARSPQLVVITTPTNATAFSESPNGSMSVSPLISEYSLAAVGRVAMQLNNWELVRDSTANHSSWTQFKSMASSNASFGVCAIIASIETETSVEIIQVTESLSAFCAPNDLVVLGFTTKIPSEYAQYLEGEDVVSGKYVPRAMKDVARLPRYAGDREVSVSVAANRLFIASPLSVCIESGGALTTDTASAASQSVRLCLGDGCAACSGVGGAAVAEPHDESSGKQGLVVPLSCGSFLLGCAVVFYILFRKQFFLPSDSTKPEKELTTNLAYVLRM